jgi:hypothetical protein
MRFSFFWDVTKRTLVINYRRFGKIIGYPETSQKSEDLKYGPGYNIVGK